MIVLFRQSDKKIQEIQQSENAYYFSAGFNVVLEKHGLLSVDCRQINNGFPSHGFVCRQTPLYQNFLTFPLVFEGPVHPIVLQTLGISARTLKTQELYVSGSGLNSSQNLSYSQFTVRKIPSLFEPSQVPFPFECDDPLWNRDHFIFQELSVPEGWRIVLTAKVNSSMNQVPVAITNDHYLILGIPIFDILSFQHCFPPLKEFGYYNMTRYCDTITLENWLLEISIKLFTQNSIPVVLAKPWPIGYEAAFSIRHDFDRPTSTDSIIALLKFYEQFKVRSTWFWLEKTYNKEQVDCVRQAYHEVALHSVAADEMSFQNELRFFAKAGQMALQGTTAHGGRPSSGYLGSSQHQWCDNANLLYGEMLGKDNLLPHNGILICNGIPAKAKLVLPTVHRSLDEGVRPEAHFADYLIENLPKDLARGAYCVLMNHPDIHISELKKVINALPLEGVWKATFSDVCQWIKIFKLTSIVTAQDKYIDITFQAPLTYASAIDLLTLSNRQSYTFPKGTVFVRIDPTQMEPIMLEIDKSLEQLYIDIHDIICKNYMSQGLTVDAAEGTIRHNTNALPKRVQYIASSINPTQGGLCAELGCGYGFLALAIHKLLHMNVIGYDRNPAFLELGNELRDRYPYIKKSLNFQVLDYSKESLPSKHFDLVTLYGTFHYVVDKRDQVFSLQNIYQALKPGGQIFINNPNPWYPKEPFTKIWFVHWLPRQIGNWITTRLGKRTLLDMDYQSPWKLKRLLQNAGFEDVNYYPCKANSMKKLPSLLSYLFCSYYSMAAKKPLKKAKPMRTFLSIISNNKPLEAVEFVRSSIDKARNYLHVF